MAEKTTTGRQPSRLLERLRRVGREGPGAVGFGRPQGQASRRAPLLLLAGLPAADGALLGAAREAGIDAAFVPVAGESPAGVPGDWPLCGLASPAGPVAPTDLDRWQEQGMDAVALRPAAALAACFSPRRGGLLALLDHHLPIDGLRAAAALPVGGYLLADGGGEGRLSGDDLLWIALAGSLLRGPALLLSRRVHVADLEALVGLGLGGLVLPFAEGEPAGTIRERVGAFRAALDALDPHLREEARDRGDRPPVVIPFSRAQE